MSNKAQGGLATVKYALNDVLQTDTDLRGISVTVSRTSRRAHITNTL